MVKKRLYFPFFFLFLSDSWYRIIFFYFLKLWFKLFAIIMVIEKHIELKLFYNKHCKDTEI